jgi:hypothetical protein
LAASFIFKQECIVAYGTSRHFAATQQFGHSWSKADIQRTTLTNRIYESRPSSVTNLHVTDNVDQFHQCRQGLHNETSAKQPKRRVCPSLTVCLPEYEIRHDSSASPITSEQERVRELL